MCKRVETDHSVELSDPGELYDQYTTCSNKNYISIETDQM